MSRYKYDKSKGAAIPPLLLMPMFFIGFISGHNSAHWWWVFPDMALFLFVRFTMSFIAELWKQDKERETKRKKRE